MMLSKAECESSSSDTMLVEQAKWAVDALKTLKDVRASLVVLKRRFLRDDSICGVVNVVNIERIDKVLRMLPNQVVSWTQDPQK